MEFDFLELIQEPFEQDLNCQRRDRRLGLTMRRWTALLAAQVAAVSADDTEIAVNWDTVAYYDSDIEGQPELSPLLPRGCTCLATETP